MRFPDENQVISESFPDFFQKKAFLLLIQYFVEFPQRINKFFQRHRETLDLPFQQVRNNGGVQGLLLDFRS